jgi:hypothetical protein
MLPSVATSDCLATIVIEWENIRLAATDRCIAMLGELGRQIEGFAGGSVGGEQDFEVILTFDEGIVSEADVRSFVEHALPRVPTRAELRYVAGLGRHYYDQKNLGGAAARGHVVVFLDSDVIPEPGWLSQLLASFDDPRVEVVCGNCFLDTPDLVSKALALGWFFPLRDDRDALVRQDWFFANNVAFRRELRARYPFEPLPGSSRGACRLLARRLSADGRGLFVNTSARVTHPAPNGLRHLALRALAQGRDNLLFERAIGKGSILGSVKRAARLQARAWFRVLRHRRAVGLGACAVPAALAVNVFYYGLYVIGDATTRMAPGWATRNLRV